MTPDIEWIVGYLFDDDEEELEEDEYTDRTQDE
jgi:hypothetical protein